MLDAFGRYMEATADTVGLAVSYVNPLTLLFSKADEDDEALPKSPPEQFHDLIEKTGWVDAYVSLEKDNNRKIYFRQMHPTNTHSETYQISQVQKYVSAGYRSQVHEGYKEVIFGTVQCNRCNNEIILRWANMQKPLTIDELEALIEDLKPYHQRSNLYRPSFDNLVNPAASSWWPSMKWFK